jgi:hypothetical protein
MKLNGKLIEARYEKKIEFNRSPEPPIVFTLQSCNDMKEFEKLCPEPKPGYIVRAGGEQEEDRSSKEYLDAVTSRAERSLEYMVITSLKDIEWETVDLNDPTTWKNWKEEMLSTGFSQGEVTQLHNMVFQVNGLSADSVKEAAKN